MESFELFYQIKSVHGVVAGVTFLLVIVSDLYGGSWVLGWQERLNKMVLNVLHKVVWAGLGFMILSGLSMVFLNSEEFLVNYIFWIKMFFVAVLFWNAGRIGKEIDLPSLKTFKELSPKQKKHMMVVGATSIVSWVSVLILANVL